MTLGSDSPITVRAARANDLPSVSGLLDPFVAIGDLLPRSTDELASLLRHAVVAEMEGQIVGFAALEIYSRKLAEIQCLSFCETEARQEIARQLVLRCAQLARWYEILEVIAIVPPSLEEVLRDCGFDFSLPNQKRALFIRPEDNAGEVPNAPWTQAQAAGLSLREAMATDLPAIAEFLAPFVARGEVLQRSERELSDLLRHAFVVEAGGRVVGFAALEVYSDKLSEIQCLSVDKEYRRQGVGRQLVTRCVACAGDHGVTETMAISLRDEFFLQCGFDYCLAGPKIALFLRPRPL